MQPYSTPDVPHEYSLVRVNDAYASFTRTVHRMDVLYADSMSREEFEKLIVEGFALLPEWVRQKIKNVALLVESEPSYEVRMKEGLSEDETLLGYYQGIPLAERDQFYGVGGTMPDTITLYRFPIEDAAEAGGLPVAQVIADTIWHEVAHHFGMNEKEVRAREEKRDAERG